MPFEDIIMLILRTLFYYFAVVVIFRLMGKREIGELSLLDIVVFIMIAELAVITIEDLETFFGYGLIPMALLMIIQRFTAWLSLKSPLFRSWFDGKPAIIISQGKIDEYQMKKNRFNFDDLMQQLRENGTESLNEVEYAILEPSGSLSIIEKGKQGSRLSGNKINGLVLPLIVDGNVQLHALEQLQKDRLWLKEQIESRGFQHFKEVSFCSLNHKNEWYIDRKNEITN
ncbi:DUF421 domain-containing protein [Gracilibacillus oryzae]|uniref:DUF421 domain-containing protein n=1 Tax=Gracilibacillus oryzae TaxID=1672701 RepID=A0A7C8GTQ2_9BACI|nr:DUF421 domain-containing protein [Gracilibacillus oryzae]KAB8134763.1 DUF421 domain-containing protein [Gracilibacillus oryzae]